MGYLIKIYNNQKNIEKKKSNKKFIDKKLNFQNVFFSLIFLQVWAWGYIFEALQIKIERLIIEKKVALFRISNPSLHHYLENIVDSINGMFLSWKHTQKKTGFHIPIGVCFCV